MSRLLRDRLLGSAAVRRACIVEVHYRFQAVEIAVVTVGFDECGIRALIDIAERRHLESPIILWCERQPPHIWNRGFAEQVALDQKPADAAVDE
jgi:hypothetical protein